MDLDETWWKDKEGAEEEHPCCDIGSGIGVGLRLALFDFS